MDLGEIREKLSTGDVIKSLHEVFGDDAAAKQIIERASTEEAALFCLAQLATQAVDNSSLDALCSRISRLVMAALLRVDEHPKLLEHAAQWVAARSAAHVRRPSAMDEVQLMVEQGVFEWLAQRVVQVGPRHGNVLVIGCRALQALRCSIAAMEEQGQRKPDGVAHAMRQILASPQLEQWPASVGETARFLVDALELVAFKEHVRLRTKQAGDGGKQMGNDLMGVVGAASGSFGFEFTNPAINKDLKQHAFEQGVIRPMQEKIQQEDGISIDGLAKSVLNSHMNRVSCANAQCHEEGAKRCARCKRVHYCSVECQRADWAQHKAACNESD